MKDREKTKAQLLGELAEMRQRVTELEASKVKYERTGEELRKSQARFKDLYENAPNAYFSVGADGLVRRCNKRAREMLGYKVEELLGRPVFQLYADTPQGNEKAWKLFQRFRAGDTLVDEELQMRKADGTLIWVNLTVSAVRNTDGQIIESRSMVADITERKSGEETLRRERGLLSQMMETSPVGITVVNREGQITFANRKAEQVLGLMRNEITERTYNAPEWHITDYEGNSFPDADLPFRRVMSTGQPVFDVCHAIVWPDGRRILLSINAAPLFDAAGQVDGMVATVEDITERKRVEEKIRELAKFPDENPNPVLRIAKNGVILYANKASQSLLDFWGCQAGQYLPNDWRTFIADVSNAGLEKENEIECAGNTFLLNWAPIADAGYVNVYGFEISKRKRAEKALMRRNRELALLNRVGQELAATLDLQRVTERLLRAVTETIGAEGASVWLWDGGQNECLVCRAAFHLGQSRPPVDLRLEPGQGIAGWVAQKGQGIITSTPDDPRFFSGIDEQIDFRTVSLLAVPLRIRDVVVGVLEVVNKQQGDFDDDDLVLVETLAASAAIAVDNAELVETLRARNTELEARNEELDAFAHTVAHDLKNPLGIITGLAGVLEEDHASLTDDELQHYLRTIAQSGRKINRIIDELLLLAVVRKLEEVEMQPLNMANIVSETQLRLSDIIEESRAEIVLPDTWPVTSGYGPWVEEIWVNYLSNAIKYGGQPPRVELGATEQINSTTRFWVRDNGPGLTPEEQARLFTPFTRLDQARAKGYGLGLSIVRRIVEKLGGQVGVESETDQGSTFFFTLPGKPSSDAESRDGKEI